jgi:hypothetical protein
VTDPECQDATAIRIERRLAAPAQAVFEAWTSAELLRRWYPPGEDWDTPVAESVQLVEIDFTEHPDETTTVVMPTTEANTALRGEEP